MKKNTLGVRQRCPKCGGNLFLNNDFYGWYEQCLQCSFILYLNLTYDTRGKVDSSKTSEISQAVRKQD
ncbi:hypothetical protein ACFLT8_03100 [Chloroflexota bacterium]